MVRLGLNQCFWPMTPKSFIRVPTDRSNYENSLRAISWHEKLNEDT